MTTELWIAAAAVAAVGLAVVAVKAAKVARVNGDIKRAQDEDARVAAVAADEAAKAAATRELTSLSGWTDRQSWPDLNHEVSGVILADTERCVAMSPGVQHLQLRKKTHYEGRSAGVSVRVMKGVSVRTGAFRGEPVTTVSQEVADYGTVFVTDQRFVFAGSREVVDVPLRKVADARAAFGTLEVLVANRANALEFRLSEGYRAFVIAGAIHLMAGASQVGGRGKTEHFKGLTPPG